MRRAGQSAVLAAVQRHNFEPVPGLLENLSAKALLANKAGDSDKIVQFAQEGGMQVIIPSKNLSDLGRRKRKTTPARTAFAGLAAP